MPDGYVLSVGVNSALTQPWAWDAYAKDAWFVSAALDGAASLYDHLHRRVLAGPRATRAAVLDGLQWLSACVQAQDVALLFFSAHGEMDPHGGYCLSLAACSDGETAGLWGWELRSALAKLRGKTVVLLDTCHAAGILTPGAPLPATFVVACGANEFSYGQTTRRDRPHGYFVMALCEALRGTATLLAGPVQGSGLDRCSSGPDPTAVAAPNRRGGLSSRRGVDWLGAGRGGGAHAADPTSQSLWNNRCRRSRRSGCRSLCRHGDALGACHGCQGARVEFPRHAGGRPRSMASGRVAGSAGRREPGRWARPTSGAGGRDSFCTLATTAVSI